MPELFAIHARTLGGLEPLLADELRELGASDVQTGPRLVTCEGNMRLLYRANLCCRTAIRILRPLAKFPATSERELYVGVQSIDWDRYLDAHGSLAIDPLVRSSFTTHSLFAAQLTKDAIVDQFRSRSGQRPSVDLDDPDLRISLHLSENVATVYLDSSGESLHKRGYRSETGEAPISETLAAGILLLAGWKGESPLVDPMCGSGTFPIEAALLARNRAPGLIRREYAFMWWPDYDARLHEELLAQCRQAERPAAGIPIFAADLEPTLVALAKRNAAAAGVAGDLEFATANFECLDPPAANGTLIMNPPYDERLAVANAEGFYKRLGDVLKNRWAGYTAWVFTGFPAAAKTIGLRTSRRVPLRNGPLECRLLRFDLYAGSRDEETTPRPAAPREPLPTPPAANLPSRWIEQSQIFHNRLDRMSRHWGKWARRQGISCYRLYDRDVPEIPLCIDRYEDHLIVSEYDRPHDHSPGEHALWLQSMLDTAAATLGVSRDAIHLRRRERQRGSAQYEKVQSAEKRIVVHEANHQFLINLSDYLDAGLFLDHRQTRGMVEKQAAGKRFLNLFAYTGAFTVYAAAGGAASSVSVDLSENYLAWARENLALNGLDSRAHECVASDCLAWLKQYDVRRFPRFDLAVIDPPTFSNSKKLVGIWDVQRDHVELLQLAMNVLAPGGAIYFSTNFRRFKFDEQALPGAVLREISRQTVPPDFRNERIHRCWKITRREEAAPRTDET